MEAGSKPLLIDATIQHTKDYISRIITNQELHLRTFTSYKLVIAPCMEYYTSISYLRPFYSCAVLLQIELQSNLQLAQGHGPVEQTPPDLATKDRVAGHVWRVRPHVPDGHDTHRCKHMSVGKTAEWIV